MMAVAVMFFYMDFSQFVKYMKFWRNWYQEKDFTFFMVIHNSFEKIVEMVEICFVYKYSVDEVWIGIIRLDLLPEYEAEIGIQKLME